MAAAEVDQKRQELGEKIARNEITQLTEKEEDTSQANENEDKNSDESDPTPETKPLETTSENTEKRPLEEEETVEQEIPNKKHCSDEDKATLSYSVDMIEENVKQKSASPCEVSSTSIKASNGSSTSTKTKQSVTNDISMDPTPKNDENTEINSTLSKESADNISEESGRKEVNLLAN